MVPLEGQVLTDSGGSLRAAGSCRGAGAAPWWRGGVPLAFRGGLRRYRRRQVGTPPEGTAVTSPFLSVNPPEPVSLRLPNPPPHGWSALKQRRCRAVPCPGTS